MKKVAICGSQELTRDKAPFDDNSYEIWSFADWICYDWLSRCDVLFEIHQPSVYMNHPRTPDYWEKLQKVDIPVYMYPIADPRVPGAIEYPLQAVLSLVSSGKQHNIPFKPLNYSGAFAIALAILLEYDVIDTYGVELANGGDYSEQQSTFAFWNGIAVGRGIEVNVNCSDGMFVYPIYGTEDTVEREKLKAYRKSLNKQIAEAHKIIAMGEGALQIIDDLSKR
jgi:hypothetical protein